MYAPCFPIPNNPEPAWHRVHPLNLTHAECNKRFKVRILQASDTVPDGAFYCYWCERIDQVEAYRTSAGQSPP